LSEPFNGTLEKVTSLAVFNLGFTFFDWQEYFHAADYSPDYFGVEFVLL
jgi:hypothetical protein